LGQQERGDESLEELQVQYDRLVEVAEEHGLNAGVFDCRIPIAQQHIECEADEADQVRQLLAKKGSFSASALWNVCGTRIGNASVVLRAQREQLALDVQKIAAQSQTRTDRRAKQLQAAQQSLDKHETNPATMNDKDWIEIIKWVLPESNSDGRLKDLRKTDLILAKLMSLDRDWKSYIPQRHVI